MTDGETNTLPVMSARAQRRQDRPREEVTLAVDTMAHGGAVLGRLDGRVGLIDGAIPGEEVRAAVRRGKKDFFEADTIEVLRAAPERVTPPCPSFGPCGGCQWQQIDYSAQLRFKRDVVAEQLRRIGHLSLDITAVHSADPWGYRHSAAIALGHAAGFRSRHTRWEIELHECLIAHPAITRLLDDLNGLIARRDIINFRGKVWLEVKVVHPTGDPNEPAIQAVLKGIAGIDPEDRPDLLTALARIAALPNVWSLAFRRAKGATVPVKGPLRAPVNVAGHVYQLPAGSFFQTNLGLLPELLARVTALAAPYQAGAIADLYCGVGLFGLWLAREYPQAAIVGIEVDPLAIDAAEATAREWGLANCRFVARPADRALSELPAVDAVIVDPPRSGLDEKLLRALIERGPQGFIYVSCEPATLARDLAILTDGGYTVQSVELFDFFPQTYHIESLAYLTKRGTGNAEHSIGTRDD
ncbi:MAG: class I SAM-dependent RNA methyltransferase [Thermomicrobiales bacterium]